MTQEDKHALPSEIVEIVPRLHARQASKWSPVVGEETYSLFKHLKLDDESKATVQREAISVLSRCIPPSAQNGRETGLVIGYIQSGKTMSFTTLTALARDNGYRLVIVITGLTTNLFRQSTERLQADLRLGVGARVDRSWLFYSNPKVRPEVRQAISLALSPDDSVPGVRRQTVLITVMKNKTHLRNLISLLAQIRPGAVPVLIIDDEADQASLNNQVKRGKESATYHQIVQLRSHLLHHTFLQYTATPQALLLINLIDILSPGFAVLLTPGSAYAGGKAFFESRFDLVRRIPMHDIPTRDYPLHEPPDSLLEAMRLFFLGVAAGIMEGRSGASSANRTMMIHPSKETIQHANYTHWVRQIQHNWSRTLELSIGDLDYADLIHDFESAYQDLGRTIDNLPSFADLAQYLESAVKRTLIIEVNAASGDTPRPDWHQQYAHIVVGGEVLNRGYTLEGLTVSYMPRSKGVGNADTIQQRARWFGYKASYLGYCRVYLADEARKSYQSYVSHEEDIRRQLARHLESGSPLSEWRRALLLSPDLRPTRSSVLDLDYVRGNYSDEWFYAAQPHCSEEATKFNRAVLQQYASTLQFKPDSEHLWSTETQHHSVVSGVSLRTVYQELLSRLRWVMVTDSQRYCGLLLQLDRYLDECPTAECSIYSMSQGQERERSTDDEGNIKQLFSGHQLGKSGITYSGDRAIRAKKGVSLQIHRLVVKAQDHLYNDVPLVAIWIPKEAALPWVAQSQGSIVQDVL